MAEPEVVEDNPNVNPVEVKQPPESKPFGERLASQAENLGIRGGSLATVNPFYMVDPEIPPYKQPTPFDKESAFYGGRDLNVPNRELDSAVTVSDDELYGDLLKQEPTTTYEDFSLLGSPSFGIQVPSDIKFDKVRGIDYSKVQTIASVAEVYNLQDPEVVAYINKKTGFADRDGNVTTFQTGMSIDEKVKMMDLGQAVSLVSSSADPDVDDYTQKIPWEVAIANRIQRPKDANQRQLRIPVKIPGTDIGLSPSALDRILGHENYMLTIPNLAEPDLRMAESMMALNLSMIEQSKNFPELKDARTRLSILDYSRSVEFNDYKKVIAEYGRTGTRAVVLDALPWMIGESLQALASIPGWIVDGIPTVPDVGPFNSVARQEFANTIMPRHAHQLQKNLVKRGVDISLGTAQYLARYSMGLPPRILGNLVEVVLPTGIANQAKKMLSVADYKAFQMYVKAQKDAGRTNIEDSGLDLITEFVEANKASVVSRSMNSIMSNKIIDKVLLGKSAKLVRVGLVNRLNIGKGVDEIQNIPLQRRSEYTLAVSLRQDSMDRRDTIVNRIAKEKRPATKAETDRIDLLERRIKEYNTDLLSQAAQQNVPKFMQGVRRQNQFFFIGASTGGELIQQLGGDPGMGEGAGMLVGLVVQGATNYNAALKFVRNTFSNSKEKDILKAQEVAMGINTFDQEYATSIMTRAAYMRELRQELIDEGLSEEAAMMSIGQITGLAVLQSLDSTTRQNLSARQLGKFGPEVQAMMDVHSTEIQLLSELRGLLSKFKQGDYPEGSAAIKMQGMIEESIVFAQKDILQREADFDVLIQTAASKVNSMINDGVGKATDFTDINASYIEQFDQAIENLLELEVAFSGRTLLKVKEVINTRSNAVSDIVSTKVDVAMAELGDPSRVKTSLAGVIPKDGAKVAGRLETVTASDLPRFTNGSDLQSLVYEISYANSKAESAAPFNILDQEQFLTPSPTGQGFDVVGSKPYVNAAPLLDSLITSIGADQGVDLLDLMSGNTVSTGAIRGSLGTISRSATEFFEMVADEGEDVAATIKNVVELAKTDPSFSSKFGNLSKLIKSKEHESIIAALYQSHLAEQSDTIVDSLKIDFTQLRKFDTVVRQMGQKAKSKGNSQAAQSYENFSGDIVKLFDNFVVDDPSGNSVKVDDLFVQTNNNAPPEKVTDVRIAALEGWTNHKATWFDDPFLSQQMGWGTRQAVRPNGLEPLGVKQTSVASLPKNWFNFDNLNEDTAEDFVRPFTLAHGTPVASMNNTVRIDPESPIAKAAIDAMRLQVAEYVKRKAQSGDLNVEELDRTLSLIQKNFVGVNRQTLEEVQLLPEIGSLVDDLAEYGSNTVKTKVFVETEKAVNIAVGLQTNSWSKQRRNYTQQRSDVVKTLSGYLPGSTDPSTLLQKLSTGGPVLINKFKADMKSTKKPDGGFYTDDDIDVVLSDMAVEAMEDNIFTNTKRFEANSRTPTELTPVYDFNVDVFADFLGVGDRNKELAMKSVLGPRRHKVATRMVEFIRNKESSSIGGLNISGIPRKMSVESYISRFYSLQREVVGAQYLATESILQRMRQNNFSLIQASLTDPIIGELFLEMLESGKPLPPSSERSLYNALVAVYAKFSSTLNREPSKDETVRERMLGLKAAQVRNRTEPSVSKNGQLIFPLHPEFDMEFTQKLLK